MSSSETHTFLIFKLSFHSSILNGTSRLILSKHCGFTFLKITIQSDHRQELLLLALATCEAEMFGLFQIETDGSP